MVDQAPPEAGRVNITVEAPKPESPANHPSLSSETGKTIADLAGRAITGEMDSRKVLQLIAQKVEAMTRGKPKEAETKQKELENRLKKLKESKNPEEQALAYDFEIAMKESRVNDLKGVAEMVENAEKALKDNKNPKTQKELTDEEKIYLEKQIGEWKGLLSSTGDLEKEVVDLRVKRDEIEKKSGKPIANGLEILAKRLEIPEEQIKQGVVDAIIGKVATAARDPAKRAEFYKFIKEKGFSKEEQEEFTKMILLIAHEKSPTQKVIDMAVKSSMTLALLNILLIWMASKEKGGGGGMMG